MLEFKLFERIAVIFLAAGLLVRSAPAQTDAVDLALVVAIDVSFSVDSDEHRLQMAGFAAALESSEVLDAIASGPHQKISITVFQWSGEDNQVTIVPWTTIATDDDAKRIASFLSRGPRSVAEGGTATASALSFGAGRFAEAPLAPRHVIDISTDGRNNSGKPVSIVRDQVVMQGITINGLAITNEWGQLAADRKSVV